MPVGFAGHITSTAAGLIRSVKVDACFFIVAFVCVCVCVCVYKGVGLPHSKMPTDGQFHE